MLLSLLLFATGSVGYGEDRPVALFISQEIKPFIEMVEGFEKTLNYPTLRVILDQKGHPFSHDKKYRGPQIDHYAYGVAVGPRALSYLVDQARLSLPPLDAGNTSSLSSEPYAKILYAMVLNPDRIMPSGISLCGISLDPFTRQSLEEIHNIIPEVKTVGVLFDPANNDSWIAHAQDTHLFGAMTLLPLPVHKQSDVIRRYHEGFSGVDALLFIPDPTVSAPTLITHLIKQALARNIPVIGYNGFFHRSGAAVSVLVDYAGIGEEMAHMVELMLIGEGCRSREPAYTISTNEKVLKLLNR